MLRMLSGRIRVVWILCILAASVTLLSTTYYYTRGGQTDKMNLTYWDPTTVLLGISGEVQTLTYWDPTTMLHGVSGDVYLRRVVHKIHNRKFTPPASEVCWRRPPTAILIGVHKCGTRELLEFLHMHPHVELYHQPRTMEMTYFRTNETYAKGDDWFVNEMPCSYSNQITIMKDSQYFDYPYPVAERIQKFNSSIKLILIVREPISRSVSQYMFGLQRKDIEPGLTLEDVIFKDNRLNEGHRIVRDSAYDTRMAAWLKFFRRDQFLILDAGDFKYSPAKVLQRVEDFLGLARFITPDHFVWNEQKGYYCIKTNLSDTGMACYSGRRGKQRIDIYPQTKQILKVISDLKFEDSLISLGVLFTGDMNKN